MSDLSESLSRTLLLMRDELGAGVSDAVLIKALTDTRVALVADAKTIASHAAQTAFITAALLMARSGHTVWLAAPNVRMQGAQPPLAQGRLIDELLAVGRDLLPGIEFRVGTPKGELDLAVSLGDSTITVPAYRKTSINAGPWAGSLSPYEASRPWSVHVWPMGALAAGGLAASEAFKIAMRRLLPYALSIENTAERFADSPDVRIELAPADTPFRRDLGELDIISGGAISHAALYCLARIPGAMANGCIIEPETADLSNLNRYMLLLRSGCDIAKVTDLRARLVASGLHFQPVPKRYDVATVLEIGPLAPSVLVGVDHIPTRWLVQRSWPESLVVGATTHWSAMASIHTPTGGCAQCLHYEDDSGDGLIPTQACVSFWAGLFSAAFLAGRAAAPAAALEQQVFVSPFRPESVYRAPVPRRTQCPTCATRVRWLSKR
jgi:hypothetical protein